MRNYHQSMALPSPAQPSGFFVWSLTVGAACSGAAGLVVGLLAYPPTAVVAVFELGIPGAFFGAVVGAIGSFALTLRGARRRLR